MAVTPYDVKINGVGYMIDSEQGGPVTVQDLQPGTARSADGEADFIRFELEAAHQITDWSGGAGQRRHTNASRWLTGIGNGLHGAFFPPYAQLNETSTGGTTSWYTRIGSTLYGKISTRFEQVGSATTITASGVPDQAPVQTGAGAIWYSSGGDIVRTTTGGAVGRGGASDATLLPTDFTVNGVAAFGRHLFAFAERSYAASPSIRQSAQFAWSDNTNLGMKWDQPTIPGNLLFAFFITNDTDGVTETSTDWEEIAARGQSGSKAQVFVVKNNDSFRSAGEIFNTTDGNDHHAVGFLVEVEGVHDGRYPDVIYDISSSKSTTTTTVGTGTAENGGMVLAFLGYQDATSDSGSIPTETGFTEIEEIQATDSSTIWISGSVQHDNVLTSASVTLGTAADITYGFLIGLTEYTVAVDQDVILATADEGESWLLSPANFTSDVMGTPRAFKAWDGYLWFTTQYGMYRMRYGEDEYDAGNQTINIAIEQVAEFRVYPQGGNAGAWLEIYDNAVYTGIGHTLFRYTEGGGFEPVFPTDDWATVGGQIRAIVQAGNVLYFGAGSYLWAFDGRSFHPVAQPAAATDMDYMAFHNGKLYLNDDPSTYFNVGNASLRSDLNDATAASYTTGYYISSRLDFHKVNILKIISEFEEQVRFTAASNSGSVTWAYALACNDDPDPGYYGGAASSLTWTTLATHNQASSSPQTTNLSTEIECKALYLRATLTPGSSGVPYLEYVSPIGRAMLPIQRRVQIPLMLRVGVHDRAGTVVYDDQSEVLTAINALRTLRDPTQSPNAVDLLFEDESVAGETIRGTVIGLAVRRMPSREPEGAYYQVTVTFDELP